MKSPLIHTFIAVVCTTVIFMNCKDAKPTTSSNALMLNATLPLYSLPQDVLDSCSIDDVSFASWFAEGKVTENGFVNPANSVTFDPENNCSFYRWSEQMFLWLTSSGAKYNGGTTVFESPALYVVSPESADNTRKLIPYQKGDPLDATVDINKTETEEGQATNNVLLDRHGNVVYYITFVNDVYATLLQIAAQNGSKVTQFPTTQSELDEILAYAKQNNINILEPNTLAIELKTSWVKLEGEMKKEDFVTIEADIPSYDKKSDSLWVLSGNATTATLALVGIHIVGSAHGHPEMIWSTFEHQYNTPNAKYQYVNKENNIVNVNADQDGYWLFNTHPKDTNISNANVSFASFGNNAITATPGHTISPSNTIRVLPWGSAYNLKPNQEDANPAYANSQVISINQSIMNKLVGNDVRKNYNLIGSTWTFGGAAPNGKSYTQDTILSNGVAIGTSNLANSTMETDFQEASTNVIATDNHSCFTCHNGSENGKPSLDPKINHGLSHVFYPLMEGIRPKPMLRKKK